MFVVEDSDGYLSDVMSSFIDFDDAVRGIGGGLIDVPVFAVVDSEAFEFGRWLEGIGS